MTTLWNVCAVAEEDVQYCEGYHQFCEGCSVLWEDTISTVEDVQYCGGYHEYCGGCSVLGGIPSVL